MLRMHTEFVFIRNEVAKFYPRQFVSFIKFVVKFLKIRIFALLFNKHEK